MTAAALEHFRSVRLSYYTWRRSAGFAANISLCIFFAALTGMLARLSFPLPWTPVPITGQTFGVLLAGAVLGRWGSLSQTLYIVLGVAGVPWFAAGSGPLPGPTMGYLAGFIAAPYIIGGIIEKYPDMRRFGWLAIMMAAVNFIVIHGPGVAWLYAWMKIIPGGKPTIMSALSMGCIPFIPGDIIKVFFAALMTYFILPKSR